MNSEPDVNTEINEPSGVGSAVLNSDSNVQKPLLADQGAELPPGGSSAGDNSLPSNAKPRHYIVRAELPGAEFEITTEGRAEDLRRLAVEINSAVQHWEDKSITLGMMLLASKTYFANSKPGRSSWLKWVKENIRLAESRVRDLMRIASAKDPVAEKKRQNENNAKRQSVHRKKQATVAALRAATKPPAVSEELQDAPASEREGLIDKLTGMVAAWARCQSEHLLRQLVDEIVASGDVFPEMPAFLRRNKAALKPLTLPSTSENDAAAEQRQNRGTSSLEDSPAHEPKA